MNKNGQINYIEWPSMDLEKSEAFFQEVFGWVFTHYGPDYMAREKQGLDCGFYRSEQCSSYEKGGALIVFFSTDLEWILEKVEKTGGTIVKPIFNFPGGRRFHFREPGGNEFAVWSE